MTRFGCAVALALAFAGGAMAQSPPTCAPPPPPPSQTLRPKVVGPRPPLPGCVNERTHTHTCRKAEIDRYDAALQAYNSAVDAWNRDGQTYVNALNAWTHTVSDYSRCEIDGMNALTPHGD